MARYGSRSEVYVVPYADSIVKYGFLTNVKGATGTALGHVEVNRASLPVGLVFGANAPKPGRASKLSATGNESSFYDIGKAAALRADGWRLSFPTIRRGKTGRRSVCAYVTLGQIKYAWMLNNETRAAIGGDLAALGIELGTSNDRDLVWGARFPKPVKGYKTTADNTTISTFIDPSKADNLPAGWAGSGREEVQGVVGADGG